MLRSSLTNYVSNLGGPFILNGYSGPFAPLNPPSTPVSFGVNTPWGFPQTQNAGLITLSGVTDGTSNTALWSEAVTGNPLNNVVTGTGKQAEMRGFFATNFATSPFSLVQSPQQVVPLPRPPATSFPPAPSPSRTCAGRAGR